jgi:hypothetical protein
MKKCVLVLILLFAILQQPNAQDTRGFRKENIFIGSGVNLGFFNGFIIGLNPEVGYSIGKILDVGVATNINYITQNAVNAQVTFRQLALGAGPFVRVWPVNRFFLGGQFEFNRISYSEKVGGQVQNKASYTAPSLLVGGGWGNRFVGQSQFYTSIMIDVLGDPLSPYTDQFGRVQPVFRTGFLFYLRPKNQQQ